MMHALAVAVVLVALAGCAGAPRAPVIERSPPPRAQPPSIPVARTVDPRPEFYTVKRGDTLYSIALDYGLDYREVAEWNSLENPNRIRIGEVLRLRPGEGAAPPAAVAAAPAQPGTGADPAVQIKPVAGTEPVQARPLGPAGSRDNSVISEPKAVRMPYSEQNLALLSRGAGTSAETRPGPRLDTRVEPKVQEKAEQKAQPPGPQAKVEPQSGDDGVEWGWPVAGRVIAAFSDPGNKGIDIGGRLGDPVFASASGRVVYSGTGLRGYGKLIIIKHNNTYLSAYAHNREILVKEGQNVAKGQKIAEVGNTDASSPRLHFEIRRLGKPVDPLKFLPEKAS